MLVQEKYNRFPWLISAFFAAARIGFHIFLMIVVAVDLSHSLPVSPGIKGFGAATTAGSGRHTSPAHTQVYFIDSLSDSGPGTLRECMEGQEARTCVFEVSGYIDLASKIVISSPYITVAGQTAPEPGIHVRGATIAITTHDVLIQHISVRPGDGPGENPKERHGILISGGNAFNVVVDHLSLTWAIDENISSYLPIHDSTFSNLLVAECLHYSIHPEGPHSEGFLLDKTAERVSIHDNLMALNNDRNIRTKEESDIEYINNLVYGWGGTSGWNQFNMVAPVATPPVPGCKLNFVGNYYKPAPFSPRYQCIYSSVLVPPTTQIFAQDNICVTRPTNEGDEWLITSLPVSMRRYEPVASSSDVTWRIPTDTYEAVSANAGARNWNRFSADTRIVSDVTNGTGSLKDCIEGCSRSIGGWPEITQAYRQLTLPLSPDDDEDGDGYTNLENYLFHFLDNGEPPPENTPTPSGTPTEPPTPTSSHTPTATPTPSETPAEFPTPTATPTTTSTASVTATDTATPSPTIELTNTPSSTPSNTPTSTPTSTQDAATATSTATATPTFTSSQTHTATPTRTSTYSPTATASPTRTATTTPTITITATVTATPTLTPPGVSYYPNLLTIITGTYSAGGLNSLKSVDADTYSVKAVLYSGNYITDWHGRTTISTPRDSVSSIDFIFTGRYSVDSVLQKIYLYNYETDLWEIVDTRQVGKGSDVTVSIRVSNNPRRYIETNGKIRMRIKGSKLSKTFYCWANYLSWKVR